MTKTECEKLTTLFKNALENKRKQNSKIIGELKAQNEIQENKFLIQLEECRMTLVSNIEKQLQEERDVFDLEKKRLQNNFELENLMQMKMINRQNQQGMRIQELYGNRVAKLINKVTELKQINSNKNNDVSANFAQPLDEKQLQLLNQLLKRLMDNAMKSQAKLKEAEFVINQNLELEEKC